MLSTGHRSCVLSYLARVAAAVRAARAPSAPERVRGLTAKTVSSLLVIWYETLHLRREVFSPTSKGVIGGSSTLL